VDSDIYGRGKIVVLENLTFFMLVANRVIIFFTLSLIQCVFIIFSCLRFTLT